MSATCFQEEASRLPAQSGERTFVAKIQNYHSTVSTYYYSKDVEQKVRSVVPWQKLQSSAREKLKSIHPNLKTVTGALADENDSIFRLEFGTEFFVMELLNWFKTDFFSWYDCGKCATPGCPLNGQSMKSKTSGQPTLEDMIWGGSRIELYRCESCGSEERFPRYNHPLKLMDTRKGRCGEWANTVTCILTVLGVDCRLVLDFTDHVWTEIYSESQNRWIHADSCENGFDMPHLYEAGWGKKLTYCIAISRPEIQDVTWRYVLDPVVTLTRRREVSESWLTGFLNRINTQLRSSLSTDQQNKLLKRYACELVDLLHVPGVKRETKDNEFQGRQSGSEEWRRARNELGRLNRK